MIGYFKQGLKTDWLLFLNKGFVIGWEKRCDLEQKIGAIDE